MTIDIEYQSFLEARLPSLTNNLSQALNYLLDNLSPEHTFEIHFEYMHGELVENFPIRAYFMSPDFVQLNDPVCNEFNSKLQDIGAIITQEEKNKFIIWEKIDDGPPVQAIEQPIYGIDNRIIVKWFIETWQEINKPAFSINAQISAHDFVSDTIKLPS